MNKTCEKCASSGVPKDVRDQVFKMFFNKTMECPIDDEKVVCIFSKAPINWDYAFSKLRKKHEGN